MASKVIGPAPLVVPFVWSLLCLCLSSLFFPGAQAQTIKQYSAKPHGVAPIQPEHIQDFQGEYWLKKDGTVSVRETITYDFGADYHHGIFRLIPTIYKRANAGYTIDFRQGKTTDGLGREIPAVSSRQGNDINLRIGSANTTVRGVHQYVINYTVRRVINFFKDEPEFYWNVNGFETNVPTSHLGALVHLPPGTQASSVKTIGFIGPYGSKTQIKGVIDENTVSFSAAKLPPKQCVTFAIRLPVHAIEPLTAKQELKYWLKDWFPAVLLPAVVGISLFSIWFLSGRDAEPLHAIPVEWDPPQGITPAEVGTLIDESCDTRDVVSTVIDVAARGFIKINEQNVQKMIFFSNKSYDFECLVAANDARLKELNDFELATLSGLFQGTLKPGTHSSLSDLSGQFVAYLPTIKSEIYESLVKKGYFRESPQTVRSSYYTVAAFLVIIGAVFSFMTLSSYQAWLMPAALGFFLSAIITALFSPAMPARTRLGCEKLRQALAFRRFVKTAEKERIRLLVKDDPTIFGRLLPYAIVLGAAEQWADVFQGLITTPPDWYSPYNDRSGVFQPDLFVGNLNSGMNTMWSSFSAQPVSTSSSAGWSEGGSGSSGFSEGGGFSGGGFGGGGTGSW